MKPNDRLKRNTPVGEVRRDPASGHHDQSRRTHQREIEKLVDSLTVANNVLVSYVYVKIAERDGRKQELLAKIAALTVEAISPEQVSQISGCLDTWYSVSFDDKRRVMDLIITTVALCSPL